MQGCSHAIAGTPSSNDDFILAPLGGVLGNLRMEHRLEGWRGSETSVTSFEHLNPALPEASASPGLLSAQSNKLPFAII